MSEPRVYAIPVLGRYGLAHGILAWARCRLWCVQNDATMLAPFWLKPRIGRLRASIYDNAMHGVEFGYDEPLDLSSIAHVRTRLAG